MAKRRSRGDGGLYWSESRQRWIAEVTVGYDGRGKRITRKASAKNKTGAKDKLKEMIRDLDDGLGVAPHGYTVGDAVRDWLSFGQGKREKGTVAWITNLADNHVIPALGARHLRELSADDVDRWLVEQSRVLGTRSLQAIHSILRRSITRAQARDKVKRNVSLLCDTPKGRAGRPSKSLTLNQAAAVLAASEGTPMHAYVVLSLLTGARTEEVRALRWDHVVAYDDARHAWVPVSVAGWDHERFAIYVWRSVRAGGDTKTKKSRRTLALPKRCVVALRGHYDGAPVAARQGNSAVFTRSDGAQLDRHTALRAFRKVITAAGLPPGQWAPREMRHSFVSLLSDDGMPLENIARLVGHVDTTTTETVYRKQIRPVVLDGAMAMDRIFAEDQDP